MRAVFNLWLIFPVTDRRLLVLSGIPCELGLFFLLRSGKGSEQETVGNRHSSQPCVSPKHCLLILSSGSCPGRHSFFLVSIQMKAPEKCGISFYTAALGP